MHAGHLEDIKHVLYTLSIPLLMLFVPAALLMELLEFVAAQTAVSPTVGFTFGWLAGLISLELVIRSRDTTVDELCNRGMAVLDTLSYDARGHDRGRLTPVDVAYLGMSVALFAFLVQVFYPLLQDASLGTGSGYLFQMIPAGMVMTILIVTYSVAIGGPAR